MSRQVAHRQKQDLPARRPGRRNYMTFPRELRDAIPELPTYVGRTLELASADGTASHTDLFGARVHLNFGLRETGKLKGRFAVRLDLEVEAARALAAALAQLADRAEQMPPGPYPMVGILRRKRK